MVYLAYLGQFLAWAMRASAAAAARRLRSSIGGVSTTWVIVGSGSISVGIGVPGRSTGEGGGST